MAQKKKNNAADQGALYTPGNAKRIRPAKTTNPLRKLLNQFNFSFELGTGFFNHNQEISNAYLVRTQTPEPWLYIFPIEDINNPPISPFNAETNWFNNSRPVVFDQLHPGDVVLRTDTASVTFKNKGTFRPFNFRVSFSIKKVNKLHLKTTGQRMYKDEDLVRFGAGISFGKVQYETNVFTAKGHPEFGDLWVPIRESTQRKFYGTVSVSAINYLDFTMFLDLEFGTWQFKSQDFNTEQVLYDPFYSVGLTFEKKFSKYFKVHIRPAVEFRNYNFEAGDITIPNKISMFSLNIGFLIKYPTYPRNKNRGHMVQMEHIYNGKIYRGRSVFRRQNPRIGQNQRRLKNR